MPFSLACDIGCSWQSFDLADMSTFLAFFIFSALLLLDAMWGCAMMQFEKQTSDTEERELEKWKWKWHLEVEKSLLLWFTGDKQQDSSHR
jgi:hypothetical protein